MSDVDDIKVKLVGKDEDIVLFDSFAIVVHAMRLLLKELDGSNTLKWQLKKASKNSPLTMELETPIASRNDRLIVDNYFQLMREIPPGASRNAITQVQAIVNVVSNDSVGHITFESSGRDSVIVWPRTKPQAPQPPKITHHSEYSCHVQLTGSLEIATTSEHDERAFYLRDRIKGSKVRCESSGQGWDDIWGKALDAMKRFKKSPRIAVYGKAQYRDDRPYNMKVESLEVLPMLEDHPGLYAVQGIDITGGVDSVAYVRSLRNGD